MKKIIIFMLLIMSVNAFSAEVIINVPKSALTSEKKTMNFLIDNYFNERDIDNPKVRNRIKNDIKKWNTHITDWKYLEDSTRIFYKKKFPIYDVSAGLGVNQFSDDHVELSDSYNKFEFGLEYYYKVRYPLFLKINYSSFSHTAATDQQYEYEGTSSLGYEVGIKRVAANPDWRQIISLQKQRIGVMSSLLADPNINYTQDQLYNNVVKQSKLKFMWLKLGVEYFFNLFKDDKVGSIQLFYGYSLMGELSVNDYEVNQSVIGHKIELNYKQYLLKKFWGKFTAQMTTLYSDINVTYSSYLLTGGMTF